MTQKEKMLKLLIERGKIGATNLELNSICPRHPARINDLRDEGYDIKTVKDGGPRFKFVLLNEICGCRGNLNANNPELPCSSCGGINPNHRGL